MRFSTLYTVFSFNCQQSVFFPIPGVNFTNIFRVAFTFKSFAWSFYVLAVKVKFFICARILAQSAFKMLVKLTPVLQNKPPIKKYKLFQQFQMTKIALNDFFFFRLKLIFSKSEIGCFLPFCKNVKFCFTDLFDHNQRIWTTKPSWEHCVLNIFSVCVTECFTDLGKLILPMVDGF